MPVYRVITKHLFRASVVATHMGIAADGTPQIVQQPGPMERLEVGTLLENVRPDELAAYGDRLELLSEEDVAAEKATQAARVKAQQEAEAAALVMTAEQTAVEAHQAAEANAAEAEEAVRRAEAADAAVKATVGVAEEVMVEEEAPVPHGRRRS